MDREQLLQRAHEWRMNHVSGVDRIDLETESLINSFVDFLYSRNEGVPEGWKLVPVEPTGAMWEAADDVLDQSGAGIHRVIIPVWEAMLAAAPPPPRSRRGTRAMTETTQTERDGTRHTAEMSEAQQVGMATTGEFILRLLNDADRLAAIERQVRELREKYHKYAQDYRAMSSARLLGEAFALKCVVEDLDKLDLAQSEHGRVPDQPDVGVIIRMVTEYNKTYRSTKNGGDAMRAAIEVWRKAAAPPPQEGESDDS